MGDGFDPFDLPNGFDPLGSDSLAPTGQSAYFRQIAPPRQQRREPGLAPPAPTRDPSAIGAGGRLAHLVPHAGKPGPADTPEAMAARLQALEDEVAILTAQFDSLTASVTTWPEDQQRQILQAVAALIDERLGWRG